MKTKEDKDFKDWKSRSKNYLLELEKFLDKADSIKDEELKREIVIQMLKVDNELTNFAEKMFQKMYERGIKDAYSKRNNES